VSRRLLWQVTLLFLVVALVPVALSDWVAMTVVTGVADRFGHDQRADAERAVGKQVLDRLQMAAMLLGSPAAVPDATATMAATATASTAALPQFLARACWQGDVDAPPSRTGHALLSRAVHEVRADARAIAPGSMHLVTVSDAGTAPRLVLVRAFDAGLVCAAELDGEYLWAPLRNAADDASWTVRDEEGRTLIRYVGGDAASVASEAQDTFTSRLTLRADFDAPGWIFEESLPAVRVEWHRWPLGGWLAAVATATLLAIALVAQRSIRQILSPLEQLTDGTRRLAAGETRARVDVRREDELGVLGTAFNDMAGELDARMNALKGLSRIDAGILGGASFDELVDRVLDRLAEVRPRHVVAVAWTEIASTSTWRSSRPADADGARRILASDRLALDIAAFEGLPHRDASASPGTWPAPMRNALGQVFPAGATLDWLPVRAEGRLQALIVLETDAVYPAARSSCLDARDRLAVAIVARNREQALIDMAAHDDLTRLANRYALHAELDRRLHAAGGAPLAVLFIDLDHFKEVNDSHGHAVGDRILVEVARRLGALAPEAALIARQGGDEFVVVLAGDAARRAADLAARLIDRLAQPFEVGGEMHRCGASVGIAMSPQHGTYRDELLRCADIALYDAKAAGRGRHRVFDAALDLSVRGRATLLGELRTALAGPGIVVHYQPRLGAARRDIRSAEALVRWQHPTQGLLLPAAFIELAESSGLIRSLGLRVLDTTIAQVAAWARDGLVLDRVSVNVSPLQFVDGDLVGDVRRLLVRHGVEGRRIELEVTESLLVGDVSHVAAQLEALRDLGITIAIDDFGTGYSSMSLLRRLPIDVMKIDRTFVSDLEHDPAAVAVARTIVTLAHALDLDIVAEGIETPGQASTLVAMGCHELQGFLYSDAVPAEAFARLVASRQDATEANRPIASP
jgi:diguanylate cyclase (GGDEF)-like protein